MIPIQTIVKEGIELFFYKDKKEDKKCKFLIKHRPYLTR